MEAVKNLAFLMAHTSSKNSELCTPYFCTQPRHYTPSQFKGRAITSHENLNIRATSIFLRLLCTDMHRTSIDYVPSFAHCFSSTLSTGPISVSHSFNHFLGAVTLIKCCFLDKLLEVLSVWEKSHHCAPHIFFLLKNPVPVRFLLHLGALM